MRERFFPENCFRSLNFRSLNFFVHVLLHAVFFRKTFRLLNFLSGWNNFFPKNAFRPLNFSADTLKFGSGCTSNLHFRGPRKKVKWRELSGGNGFHKKIARGPGFRAPVPVGCRDVCWRGHPKLTGARSGGRGIR